MTFIQSEFVLFYGLIFALYWGVRHRVAQNLLLLVASAVFYGWVHPWFLLLLYASALVDYFAGLAMERWPRGRNGVLAVSLTANLGLLAYFKYWDFFVESVAALLRSLGLETTATPLGILLPAGISFYTFQSMAYSIDIWRGELRPRRSVLDYLLAVSFFCHLVAGPIQRASNLLVQAETPRVFLPAAVRSGFALAVWGAFKKVVCADTVSPYVDKVYGLEHPSGAMVWAATLGFTVQILADFSGYTDIARGTARMLGWELMENFRSPYLAANPSEFWRRWHISFSTWIRDYLYVSLGGSRGGFWRVTAVTFATMGLSGLWHGASWNFVAWGLYHAALIVAYRVVSPHVPTWVKWRPAAVGLMFTFTVFGWFLFRETDPARILTVLRLNPFVQTPTERVAAWSMVAVTILTALPLVGGLLVQRYVAPRIGGSPWYLPLQTTAWAAMAVCLFVFQRLDAMNFIYFQF